MPKSIGSFGRRIGLIVLGSRIIARALELGVVGLSCLRLVELLCSGRQQQQLLPRVGKYSRQVPISLEFTTGTYYVNMQNYIDTNGLSLNPSKLANFGMWLVGMNWGACAGGGNRLFRHVCYNSRRGIYVAPVFSVLGGLVRLDSLLLFVGADMQCNTQTQEYVAWDDLPSQCQDTTDT
jgi:hypothetical protein